MTFVTDLHNIFYWWFLFLVLGISSFPITTTLLSTLWEKGYVSAKIVGWLVTTYLLWLLSSLQFATFSFRTLLIVVLGWVMLNSGMWWRQRNSIRNLFHQFGKRFLVLEVLFLTSLLSWSLLRATAPEVNSVEKFMDYGFINAILRSESMPPEDPWYAGTVIPYYYFGHVGGAVMTLLSQLPLGTTYNLLIATLFAFTLSLSFVIGASLSKHTLLAGSITAILVAFRGNLHYAVHLVGVALGTIIKPYDFAEATRFIDRTIHEFPLYSFIIGDYHAHLINLPNVLLFFCLLLALLKSPKHYKRLLGSISILLGVMMMTNPWDVPTYLALLGLSLLVYSWPTYTLPRLIISLGLVITASAVISAPFWFHWSRPFFGIGVVTDQSPVSQWLTVWGIEVVIIALYSRWVYRHSHQLTAPDRLIASWFLVGVLLVFLPEILYVSLVGDLVTITDYRSNTMFKLVYQAWIILSIASGVVLTRFIFERHHRGLIIGLICIGLLYPLKAIHSYYNGLTTYKGLDGSAWLQIQYPHDYAAIKWLANQPQKGVVVEAVGDSYTDFGRVSVFSGHPTILGWPQHEFLWRAIDPTSIVNRAADVDSIYTTTDTAVLTDTLQQYRVTHVVVGEKERQRYPRFSEATFQAAGLTKVFASNQTQIFSTGAHGNIK